ELDGRITSVATNELSRTALTLAAKRAGKLGAEGRDDKVVELTDDWLAAAALLPSGRWTGIDDTARGPLAGLRDSLWSLRDAVARAPEGEAAHDPEKNAERQNLSNHLQELHDAIVRILTVFDEEDAASQRDVVWLDRDDR